MALSDTEKRVYRDAAHACGIKGGDSVRVLRKAEDYEAGWPNMWVADMDDVIGGVYSVTGVNPAGEVFINTTGNPACAAYSFPYFVLEKVQGQTPRLTKKRKAACKKNPQFKVGDKVIVTGPDICGEQKNRCGGLCTIAFVDEIDDTVKLQNLGWFPMKSVAHPSDSDVTKSTKPAAPVKPEPAEPVEFGTLSSHGLW